MAEAPTAEYSFMTPVPFSDGNGAFDPIFQGENNKKENKVFQSENGRKPSFQKTGGQPENMFMEH
jgi:hypothetical protein